MVVEPHQRIRYLLRRNFEKRNWIVSEAENGEQAIECLLPMLPSVVVIEPNCDINCVFFAHLYLHALAIPLVFATNPRFIDTLPPPDLTPTLKAVFFKPFELHDVIKTCSILVQVCNN